MQKEKVNDVYLFGVYIGKSNEVLTPIDVLNRYRRGKVKSKNEENQISERVIRNPDGYGEEFITTEIIGRSEKKYVITELKSFSGK